MVAALDTSSAGFTVSVAVAATAVEAMAGDPVVVVNAVVAASNATAAFTRMLHFAGSAKSPAITAFAARAAITVAVAGWWCGGGSGYSA